MIIIQIKIGEDFMKKIGIVAIAIVAVIGIYYITIGSTQIVEQMKQEINSEVTQLQKVGFNIKDREVKEKKEHFTVAFDDSKKITNYLKGENLDINNRDVEFLKGGEFGIDIEYLPTAKDAIAVEIYPTKLPLSMYKELGKENNKTIKNIEQMIKDKLFLVHLNINKLSNAFDGYIKDIDKDGFISRGFKFDGKIDNNEVTNVKQSLELISYSMGKELDMNISAFKTDISNITNDSISVDYNIKSIRFKSEENQSILLIADNIDGILSSDTKKGLYSEQSDFNISSIKYTENRKETLFQDFQLSTAVKNINEKALKKLQNFSSEKLDDKETTKELTDILKKITTADSSIEISNIAIKSITTNGQKIDGFSINAFGKINRDFDWKQVDKNPMALLNLLNAKINIEASNDIVGMMASNPNMMMIMMLIQPMDKNGKKVFNIEFNKGSLKVNGKPLM